MVEHWVINGKVQSAKTIVGSAQSDESLVLVLNWYEYVYEFLYNSSMKESSSFHTGLAQLIFSWLATKNAILKNRKQKIKI